MTDQILKLTKNCLWSCYKSPNFSKPTLSILLKLWWNRRLNPDLLIIESYSLGIIGKQILINMIAVIKNSVSIKNDLSLGRCYDTIKTSLISIYL